MDYNRQCRVRRIQQVHVSSFSYDVTKFAPMHPGGGKLLLDLAGTDCSEIFWDLHRREVLTKYFPRLAIGEVSSEDKKKARYFHVFRF